MRIINLTTTLGALALTAATLGACSNHESSGAAGAYCQELKGDKAYFQTLSGSEPDLTRLDEAFSRMHSLASAAPSAVVAPWGVLDDAVTTIEDALDEAGITVDDLVEMQGGEIPADVDLEKLAALGPTLEALSGDEVDHAAEQIADHAKQECGVDLEVA